LNIAEWLAAMARARPAAPAPLTGFDLDADYATFARRAASIGAALARDHDIAAGDRVALPKNNYGKVLKTTLREMTARG
jgi:long-chain acyl-CoA synthetase